MFTEDCNFSLWGFSFQIIKQKIENMKVDRTKLKKTPTEAVSMQKFALLIFFSGKIAFSVPIQIIQYVCTYTYHLHIKFQ